MTSIQKICTRCKNSYPTTTEYFTANARYVDGFVTWCRACHKAYRLENHERALQRSRDNYAANREERVAYARQYRQENKEVVNARDQQRYYENMQDPEWREKEQDRNRKRSKPSGKRRHYRHKLPRVPKATLPKVFSFKSQVRTCTKCGETFPATLAYFNAHKASGGLSSWCIDCHQNFNRVNTQQWRQEKPDASRQYYESTTNSFLRAVQNNKHRARKMGIPGEFAIDDLELIQIEQHDRCIYCQIPLRGRGEVEHIIPLTRNGHNWPENIALACSFCNRSKGNKLPDEWECMF